MVRSEWFCAVYSMDHRKLKSLLQKNKHSRDENGLTAMQTAALYGDLETVKILAVEEVGVISPDGDTALTLAIKNRHIKVIRYLAELEGRLVLPNGRSALTAAIDTGDIDIVRSVLPHSINMPMVQQESHSAEQAVKDAKQVPPMTAFQYAICSDFHALIPLFGENMQITEEDYNRGVEIAKGRGTRGAELCLEYLARYKDLLLQKKCANCKTLTCKIAQLEHELKEAEALPHALKNELTRLKSVFLRRNCVAGKCIGCKSIIIRENTESPCGVCKFDPGYIEHIPREGRNYPLHSKLKDALGFAIAETLSLKAKASMDDSITGVSGLDPEVALEGIAKKLAPSPDCAEFEGSVACMLAATRALIKQVHDNKEYRESPTFQKPLTCSSTSAISTVTTSTPLRSYHSKNPPSPEAAMQYQSETAEETERVLRSLQRALEDIRMGWPSLLMQAAVDNNVEQAGQLLFQANLQDKNGKTALMHAAECGNVEMVRLLVGKEARRSDEQGCTALMYAVAENSLECAKLLVEKEAAMATGNKHRHKGTTALMIAARNNFVELVKLLIEKEAKLTRDDGVTALMQAAQTNAHTCIRLLASKEARRCTNDEFLHGHGYTALMFAASNGHLEAVKTLVHYEASIRLPDGRQAIDLASEKPIITELERHLSR